MAGQGKGQLAGRMKQLLLRRYVLVLATVLILAGLLVQVSFVRQPPQKTRHSKRRLRLQGSPGKTPSSEKPAGGLSWYEKLRLQDQERQARERSHSEPLDALKPPFEYAARGGPRALLPTGHTHAGTPDNKARYLQNSQEEEPWEKGEGEEDEDEQEEDGEREGTGKGEGDGKGSEKNVQLAARYRLSDDFDAGSGDEFSFSQFARAQASQEDANERESENQPTDMHFPYTQNPSASSSASDLPSGGGPSSASTGRGPPPESSRVDKRSWWQRLTRAQSPSSPQPPDAAAAGGGQLAPRGDAKAGTGGDPRTDPNAPARMEEAVKRHLEMMTRLTAEIAQTGTVGPRAGEQAALESTLVAEIPKGRGAMTPALGLELPGGGCWLGGGGGGGGCEVAEWVVPDKPQRFQVSQLELDPGRRRTGLPLRVREWKADSVFVVSTREPGQPPRESLRQLDELFHKVGLTYTQVFAPLNRSRESLSRYEALDPGHPLWGNFTWKAHELLYALSHLELWAHIIRQRIPYALIFEDDAVFLEEPAMWRSALEQGLRQLNLVTIQSGRQFAFDALYLSRQAVVPYGELFVTANLTRAQPSRGTHAYLLSLRGARKLFRCVKLNRPVSEAMWSVPGMVMLAMEPAMGRTWQYRCVRKREPCREKPPERDAIKPLRSRERSLVAGSAAPPVAAGKGPAWWFASAGRKAREEQGPPPCGTAAQCLQEHRELVAPGPEESVPRAPFYPRMPSKLHMWPTFVVNLKQDRRRFQELQARLGPLGFGNVTQALAVDVGSSKRLDAFAHLIDPQHRSYVRMRWFSGRPFLTRGEVGCSLSHFMVWCELLARQVAYAIVLEDDAELADEFRDEFEGAVEEANGIMTRGDEPRRFDIMFIGGEPTSSSLYYRRLGDLIVESPMSWCTYAYIISLEGARKVVESFYVNDPLDASWWRAPGLRAWAFSKKLADHLSKDEDSELVSRVQDGNSNWRADEKEAVR